ncbi:MAG: hypothetical protein GW913_05040 [Myxococcales bacterium]|nr:hypothetical protein [Myxococcales bacterium]
MRTPAFLSEIESPAWRSRLRAGIASGYGVTLTFALLAYVAGRSGITPHVHGIYAVIAFKLVANTIAWAGLRADRGVLWTQSLNTLADLLAMTGAIYLTGGPLSPLLAVYVITISVLGLLANTGITLLAAAVAFLMHLGVTLATYFGLLPFIPPPMSATVAPDGFQTIVALVYAAFMLGTSGLLTSRLTSSLRLRKERLRARTVELIAAREARTLLLANVTHELRTPLHGILGTLELFEAGLYGDVNEQASSAHVQMRRAAESLNKRVDDLLSLTRAEAGKLAVHTTQVDVPELLANVEGSVRWMVEAKSIELSVDRDESLSSLFTDRGKLSQVLLNLLVNAVKFTEEGGRITLRAMRRDDEVVFEVEDTGIGIPEDELASIFEAFYQVDGSDERSQGGVGLGLTIVDRMLDLLDGEFEIESRVGEGSTFRVVLPEGEPAP